MVENLDTGAVENWLVNTFLCSRTMRPHWEWTFYCILGSPGRLDTTVVQAGGNIIYAPVTISNKWAFLNHLRKSLLAKAYDILHVHHDYLSGFYLLATLGIRFNKRILHVHNNDKALPVGNAWIQYILLSPLRWLGFLFSDILIGISQNTLQQHFQGIGKSNIKPIVLYYGIDLKPFEEDSEHSVRLELNIPAESKLILFVGRMNQYKNPLFVLEILREITLIRDDVYGIFIGRGDLESDLFEKTRINHLEKYVRILGWRKDIALIMKQANLFVFPRLEHPKEGLGLVVIEAQAAGLPMVITHGIVEDSIVIPELTTYLSLENDAKQWAIKVMNKLDNPCKITKLEALNQMKQSNFELFSATRNLVAVYEGQ